MLTASPSHSLCKARSDFDAFDLPLTINKYNQFVRKYLAKGFDVPDTELFLKNMTTNSTLDNHYSAKGLIDELRTIESDYSQLRNNISFVPYYESLIDRISYKWHHVENSETKIAEQQKLKYLYTAVKSRLFGINAKKNYVTVADLNTFLSSIKENILELKTIANHDHIEKYRNEFLDKLESKIASANDMIQNTMLPFINKTIIQIKDGVVAMKVELKKEADKADEALKNSKKNAEILQKRAIAGAIVGAFDLAATGLALLGPQCAIVGAGIKGATIVTNAILDKTLTTTQVDIPSKLKEDKVKKVAENAQKHIQDIQMQYDILEDILQDDDVKSQLEDKNKQKWEDMKTSVEKIKLYKNETEAKLPNKGDAEILKTLFSSMSDVFKDLSENDKIKNNEKVTKLMKGAKNVASFGAEVVTYVQTSKDKFDKVDEANAITKQVEQQIELIKLQELNILNVMMPQLEMMIKNVHKTANSQGEEHVQLIVARWSIQNTLQDVKRSFNDISANFEANDDLNICIQKITEAITTVIEVHNQIDSYRDTSQLANLIADISNTQNNLLLNVQDPAWFIDMTKQIKKNLVIEQFEMALDAAKHHMFPFVADYLIESDKLYRNVTDENDLIAKVAFKINEMANQLNNEKALVTINKNHIAGPYNFEKNEAFYRWNQNGYKSEIQNLFNGTKVTLSADINRGLALSSVKFNKIWIRFVLSDSSKEREFNEKLDQLNVRFEMEMGGNTYYRCDNRIYYMPLDEPIQFFLTLNNTNPKDIRDPGGAYETLQQNAFFLSPYSTWKISMEAKKLESLKTFSDDVVEILLEGTGKHLEKKDKSFIQEICSEDLDQYYSFDSIHPI